MIITDVAVRHRTTVFVLMALIVWIFSTVEFPRQLPGYGDGAYLLMGISAALFFFLSLLLHELAQLGAGSGLCSGTGDCGVGDSTNRADREE